MPKPARSPFRSDIRCWKPLLLLAGFSLLTAIFFSPRLPHISTAFGAARRQLSRFLEQLYASHPHRGFFFTRLIRFPEGVSLVYHSFAYPQVFAVWALNRLYGTSLPALLTLQNLTLLARGPDIMVLAVH